MRLDLDFREGGQGFAGHGWKGFATSESQDAKVDGTSASDRRYLCNDNSNEEERELRLLTHVAVEVFRVVSLKPGWKSSAD